MYFVDNQDIPGLKKKKFRPKKKPLEEFSTVSFPISLRGNDIKPMIHLILFNFSSKFATFFNSRLSVLQSSGSLWRQAFILFSFS